MTRKIEFRKSKSNSKFAFCFADKFQLKMDLRVQKIFDKYANFITNNSETTGDVEMLCKYLSYFVSGELNFKSFDGL
jgi:hypothetical protein